jgi:hypothetical protein
MPFTPLTLLLLIGWHAALGGAALQRGIYGLRQPVQLSFVDPKSGNVTDIGPQFPSYYSAQELGDIDLRRQLFWTIIFDSNTQEVAALALHLENGTIAKKLPLPLKETIFIGVGQDIDIVPDTGHPIIVGQQDIPGPHIVFELDPETAVLRHIAEIEAPVYVLGASAAYDLHTHQDWVMFAVNESGNVFIQLYGVDIHTGKIQKVPENVPGHILTTMQYDPKSKSLIGLGIRLDNDTYVRTLNTFEPKSNRWTHHDMSGWWMQDGGLSALDAPNGVVYAVMQKTGEDPDGPWWLAGFDRESAATRSAVEVCLDIVNCVWSIEFYYEH